MAQRHEHDNVAVVTHEGASDPTSARFVPVGVRDAFTRIPSDFDARTRRDLYRTKGMIRQVAGQTIVLNPADSDDDLETAVVMQKVAEASRIVAREKERQQETEQSKRIHTCQCCGRYDMSARNGGGVAGRVRVPDCWCDGCRAELERQEIAEHAKRVVAGETVAERVAAARKDQGRAKAS